MIEARRHGTEAARGCVRTPLGDFALEATAGGVRAVTPAGATWASPVGFAPGSAWALEPREPPAPAGSPWAREPRRGPAGAGCRAWALERQSWPAAAARRHLEAAADALRRYAAGDRAAFAGRLDVAAPEFHREVWRLLRAIPFGETVAYGDIARDLGLAGQGRAVGAAIAANPVCLLVPCHRVVGADGSLRGFAWGLDLKRRLLAHEGSAALRLFG